MFGNTVESSGNLVPVELTAKEVRSFLGNDGDFAEGAEDGEADKDVGVVDSPVVSAVFFFGWGRRWVAFDWRWELHGWRGR